MGAIVIHIPGKSERQARFAAANALSAAEQATLVMAAGGEGEPATWDGIQPAIDWALEQRNPLNVMKWHEPC